MMLADYFKKHGIKLSALSGVLLWFGVMMNIWFDVPLKVNDTIVLTAVVVGFGLMFVLVLESVLVDMKKKEK